MNRSVSGESRVFMSKPVHWITLSLLCMASAVHAAPKADWDSAKITEVTNLCNEGIMSGAKAAYLEAMQAAGNDSPAPFPEHLFSGSLATFCTCISNKAAETYTHAEFSGSGASQFMPLINQSIADGSCTPQGKLKALLGS